MPRTRGDCPPAVLAACLVAGLLAAPAAAFFPGMPDFCACTKLLSPVCKSTEGGWASESADCADKCSDYDWSIDCIVLRYYTWRRKCSCSMWKPTDIDSGVCHVETGVILSRDLECAECMKLDPETYTSCNTLPEGVTKKLKALDDWEPCDSDPMCNACTEDPVDICSMTTGQKVANNSCEAATNGHKWVLPCAQLGGLTTADYFDPSSCLAAPEASKFVGKVAGYAGCQAAIHKCTDFVVLDGAMVHSLCDDGELQCPATASETVESWPECKQLLEHGGGSCTAAKAKQHFDETIEALCAPLGSADFPSY